MNAQVSEADVEACLPMVRATARNLMTARMVPPHMEADDLISAGTVGLIEARDRFSTDRGAVFKTFAAYRVRGAMLDHVRAVSPASRQVYSAARAGTGAGVFDVQLEHMAHPETVARVLPEAASGYVIGSRLDRALKALDARDQFIIREYFFNDKRQSEIAADLGLGHARVFQLHTRALKRLRTALMAKGDCCERVPPVKVTATVKPRRKEPPPVDSLLNATPSAGWRQPASETVLRRKHILRAPERKK